MHYFSLTITAMQAIRLPYNKGEPHKYLRLSALNTNRLIVSSCITLPHFKWQLIVEIY